LNDTTHFSINSAGVVTNATPLALGVYGVEVRAYDPYGHYCTATLRVTVQDTLPPTWDELPTDQVVECGTWFRYDVNASDLSGIDYYWVNSSAFTVNTAGVITNATALPVGVYWLEVRAYDPYSHFCSVTLSLTVQDTMAPTWDPTPTYQVLEYGSDFRYDVNATDPSGIDHYWVNDTTHFSIDTNGLITDTALMPVGVYTLEVRAYDPYGHYCSATFTLTVHDTTPPEFGTIPSVLTFGYEEPVAYGFSVTDRSGIDHYTVNDTVHFAISNLGVLTSVSTLVPGRYGLTVTAYDAYDNHASVTLTIIIEPATSPPPIPGFTWPAILLASVAAVSLSLYRRRRRH
jgi:hypothetical protein